MFEKIKTFLRELFGCSVPQVVITKEVEKQKPEVVKVHKEVTVTPKGTKLVAKTTTAPKPTTTVDLKDAQPAVVKPAAKKRTYHSRPKAKKTQPEVGK